MKMRKLSLFTLVALWFVAQGALAQTAAAPATSSSGPLISADDFYAMINSLKAVARTMSPYLLDEGIGLTSIFFGIGLFLVIIRLVFGPADPGVKADAFLHFLKGGLVMMMLASWVTYGVGPNQENVVAIGQSATKISSYKLPVSVEDIAINSFDSMVNGIFDKWGGGGGKEKVFNTIGQSWNMMWKANEKRDQLRDQTLANAKAAADTGGNQSIYSTVKNGVNAVTSKLDISARLAIWLEKIGDKVVTFIVACLVALAAFVMMIEYLYIIYWGDIMAFLGMFLGPLMVPCLLFPYMKRAFDKWIDWMLQAGFFKLIGGWIAILTMKTVEQIQNVANSMYSKSLTTGAFGSTAVGQYNGILMDAGFLLSIVMTLIYMWFGIKMMRQVPELSFRVMNGAAGAAAAVTMKTADSAVERSTGHKPGNY